MSALLVGALECSKNLLELVAGYEEKNCYYQNKKNEIKVAINKLLWKDEKQLYVDGLFVQKKRKQQNGFQMMLMRNFIVSI